jgi:cellulose synthase/poly-beta-1,6-N-acetylglucosamine synthase-like glycosyltransferase
VIWTRHGERHFEPFVSATGYPTNKVSIHVPIHNEPPEMVCETLLALSKLDYPNFEVLILDNNTVDATAWQPVRDYCAQLGERFRFFHLENWPGFKAGALNYGLTVTAKDADIIAVIDSDYQVKPEWLRTMVPYFAKEDVGFVQSPQDYRDRHESLFKNMCYWEYAGFFHIGMVQRNYFNAVIQHGTMTLVRRSALEKVGGWAEWCICEDAELGVKLYRAGYDSVYVNHSFGRGLTADTLAGYIGQRFRWAYGAVQIVKHHWSALAPWSRKGGLTPAQRYYFLAGWLPWFADGLALLFTITSIGLSAFALYQPKLVQLPVAAFLIPTIGSFAFKFIRSLWLYAVRVKDCTFIESLGAGIAALGLTHTVAKAMLNGMVTSGKPFFRTPKCEDKPPLAAALIQVREEAVMLTVLWGLAAAFIFNPDFSDSLSRLWVCVLLVQSVPYAAAVLLSFINVLPALFKRTKDVPAGALSPAE